MTEPVERKHPVAKAGKWIARLVVRRATRYIVEYLLDEGIIDLIKDFLHLPW
ncbi:hypothetical protein ACGFZG_24910 [Streptomyces antibioticus]|uniref:hypothetical protein n=1 Tax=Streptomyces antibioticus TaxID=1890 RepID=UPI0037152E41